MSNVSIFEKKWLDLVFEGKNHEYGAYQLRRDSAKTTISAFFFGVLFVAFLSVIGLLLSSFGTKPTPVIPDEDIVIRVDNFHEPIDLPEPKSNEPKTAAVPVDTKKDNQNYVVAPTEIAKPDIPVTATLPKVNIPEGNPDGGTGNPDGGIPNSGGGTAVTPIKIPDNKLIDKSELDRQPLFPGGIKNFYDYIGKNFEKQEIEEGETVRVLVSFVIERDGAMTDIKILQKTTPEVDKEAIRVLKSLKTKWNPGYKDKQPVRTQFTLPITVMM